MVVEREPATSERSRAPAIHVRTREVFRQWGVEARLLDAGVLEREIAVHSVDRERLLFRLDFGALEDEAERPGLLVLEQGTTERILREAVEETGMCDLRFGTEAIGVDAGEEGVGLRVRAAGREARIDAAFLAGCDGAGSFVRGALGLPFDGLTYPLRAMLGDVRVEDGRDALPWPRLRNGRGGLTMGIRLRAGAWRIIRLERGEPRAGGDVDDAEVRRRAAEVLGEGPVEVEWASRFRIHRRSAPRFRVGRVLLVGDAAHLHSPAGGQGMNAGIADAHNLAWKLAAALAGGDRERLLDSYDVERRAVVVGSVSRYTGFMTRVFMQAPAPVRAAAFALLRAPLAVPRFRRAAARRTAMIDLDYPPSPLLDPSDRSAGVRLPDPLLRAPDGGEVRLYSVLPDGAALLRVGAADDVDVPPPVGAVVHVGAGGHADPTGWLRGLVGADHGWILVRPDRHVAWARPRVETEAVRRALGG